MSRTSIAPIAFGIQVRFALQNTQNIPYANCIRDMCCKLKTDLYGPVYLTGTQATGAGIDVSGRSRNYRLNPFHIGLPGSVASPVRVGNLYAETNTFIADVTFCHCLHLLYR